MRHENTFWARLGPNSKTWAMGHAAVYAKLNQIQYLQIDHTSRCNLLCVQCARVHQGKQNPILPQEELSLNDYQRIFGQQNLPQLEEIFFCGNFGDASVSQSFLPSLEYLRSIGIRNLKLSTNGSARNVDWWKELAKILHRPRDLVAFSIDGLENTNHLYRVNSHWDKIMQNAAAFIAGGGRARWDFIVFAHNEHQIEEARALAKKMGFIYFNVKRSSRFLKFATSPVAAPENREWQGDAYKKIGSTQEFFGIDCRFRQERIGAFIDFQAKLWPCCWMAAPIYQPETSPGNNELQMLVEKYGKEFNSLRHHSFSEILAHEWLGKELVHSWEKADKNSVCGQFCTKKIHYSSESPVNRSVEKLNHRSTAAI